MRLRRTSSPLAAAVLVLAQSGAACKAPDPREQFEIAEMETYWAVDSPRSGTVYIAPVLRFRLTNRSARSARSVEAQAGFRRVGALDQEWASGFVIVATGRAPLAAGASTLVEIKSEGRYSMIDTAPEDMLKNEGFQDAQATLYLRSGNSSWTPLAEGLLVERRIGSKSSVIPTVPLTAQP